MATWHDTTSIKAAWKEAKNVGDEQLAELLEVAREECEAFAPADDVADPDNIPTRVRLAHALHTAAIWQSQNTSGQDDTIDLSGRTVAVYPMDWQVKNHLRPQRGTVDLG